jgi:hypothetical protein
MNASLSLSLPERSEKNIRLEWCTRSGWFYRGETVFWVVVRFAVPSRAVKSGLITDGKGLRICCFHEQQMTSFGVQLVYIFADSLQRQALLI